MKRPHVHVSADDLAASTRSGKNMGIRLSDIMRQKGTPFAALGLDDPALSDDVLLDAIQAHPILINRPIVVTAKGVRLCRPPETVLDLLDTKAPAEYIKAESV